MLKKNIDFALFLTQKLDDTLFVRERLDMRIVCRKKNLTSTRTAMEQSGLTRWSVDELAVLYTLHAGVPGRYGLRCIASWCDLIVCLFSSPVPYKLSSMTVFVYWKCNEYVCVLFACVSVRLYVFMCMYLSLCGCVRVCVHVIVRVCACVTVCGVCVRVCVVKWIMFHVCVCVWQCETLAPPEYSRTQKRENSHPRTHKIEPTAAARHPWLGCCAPHEIPISIR